MKKTTVDIIIPTYNQEAYTVECIQSIIKHTSKFDYKIIWVDNGSTTISRMRVIEALKLSNKYLSICSDKRLGFVKATNLGLKYSINSDYIVLLNNDTIVHKNWLKTLIAPMIKDKSIGITGPNTTKDTSRQSYNLDINVFKHLMPRDLECNSPDDINDILFNHFKYEAYEIDMLAFFCGVITRKCFDEVGLLSEKFGEGYSDDTDYSNRARSTGYKLYYVPGAYVTHFNRTTFLSVYSIDEISSMMQANKSKLLT